MNRASAVDEGFAKHFEEFLEQQSLDLQALRLVAHSNNLSNNHNLSSNNNLSNNHSNSNNHDLVEEVLDHYQSYYRAKARAAREDVLPIFSPTWTSRTENVFLWVAGWRPSLAFHLLYSKSSVDSNLSLLLDAIETSYGDDGDFAAFAAAEFEDSLSHEQRVGVDELQRETIKAEREISEEEARAQEGLASREMVELTSMESSDERMRGEMKGTEEEMAGVVERADRLRMETLRGVVGILRPEQAVRFLIAAAELHLRLHEFGKRRDHQSNATTGDHAD